MSVNSSSTSHYKALYFCTSNKANLPMAISLSALRILLLVPLSTFVLYLGHQRWRQHRSSKPATHSDIFTYHVAAMELIGIMGVICSVGGVYTYLSVIEMIGFTVTGFLWYGESLFYVLTCVERYLAVVHPITYMGLRNARGAKIRNICIGCVWLLSFGLMVFIALSLPSFNPIPVFCILVPSIMVMSFCSLSVLCVLIRPGPGEGGREKQRVDQSKQRAFYTITAISVTVWLWFGGLLVSTAVNTSPELSEHLGCVVTSSVPWLNLPSSLVSPLLYLHREGKLSWCC